MRDQRYYQARLDQMIDRRNAYMRKGKLNYLPQMDADIAGLREIIKQCERDREARKPKPVTDLFTHEQIQKSGLIPAVLEIHLAADYLAACCYTVEDIVKQLGGVATSVIPEIKDVITRANNFCDALYEKDDENATDIIENDEALMRTLHSKTMKHILQRLALRNKGKKQ